MFGMDTLQIALRSMLGHARTMWWRGQNRAFLLVLDQGPDRVNAMLRLVAAKFLP